MLLYYILALCDSIFIILHHVTVAVLRKKPAGSVQHVILHAITT